MHAVWENRHKRVSGGRSSQRYAVFPKAHISSFFHPCEKWKFQDAHGIKENSGWPGEVPEPLLATWGVGAWPARPSVPQDERITVQSTSTLNSHLFGRNTPGGPASLCASGYKQRGHRFVPVEPSWTANLWVTPRNYLRIGKKKPLRRGPHSTLSLSTFPSSGQALFLSTACVSSAERCPQGAVTQPGLHGNENGVTEIARVIKFPPAPDGLVLPLSAHIHV